MRHRIQITSISFLATLNFALIFVGYPIVTTLFLPSTNAMTADDLTSISRTVTVPYRAFVLLLSVWVMLQSRRKQKSIPLDLKLYFVFWLLLLIRIFYDFEIRTDVSISSAKKTITIIYIFLTVLLPTYAVIRSFNKIDFKLAFKIVFGGFILFVLLQFFLNPSGFSVTQDVGGRAIGNIALNPIALGHCGTSVILLALFAMNNAKGTFKKLFLYLVVLFGAVIMLRAASRGPLIALLICFIFYKSSGQRNSVTGFVVAAFLLVTFLVLYDQIFYLIEQVSPTMAERMTFSESSDRVDQFSNGRSDLYSLGWAAFVESPLFGSGIGIFSGNSFGYSHNMILDSLMGTGIIGGFIFAYLFYTTTYSSYKLIKLEDPRTWLALIAVQKVIAGLFSGCFYEDDTLNVAMVTIFLIVQERNRKELTIA